MKKPTIQAFDLPAAWKAADYSSKDTFAVDLQPYHLEALEMQVACFKKANGGEEDMSTETFPLKEIAADISAWRQVVQDGPGMILLRGIPVDVINLDDLRLMYLGLGTHFGRPVSQSNMGELVGEVVNIGGKVFSFRPGQD